MSRPRFVLLDRDGTIIVERHYLSDPDQVELLPGAAEGLAKLSAMGLGLVVVTNQSGIGRGYFDEGRVEQIHRRMCQLLAAHGVFLDGIYICPHRPEDQCLCRKPRTGLVQTAAMELGFMPHQSFMIGDKACDVELGRAIGACSILVRSGYGASVAESQPACADHVVDDLAAAAVLIETLIRPAVHPAATKRGIPL
ncbi:MAG TPA: HAD family hydrolase [Tepidisphaeraceae bacterium]|nr:HAD family hydrolase [Tepidisphaeraceae bacterium]